MLFDLRGRGRRRTVQVIYLSLAILMGGGLVLFGIGGATSGGLFDAIGGSGSGTTSVDARLREARSDTYSQALKANPKDAAALGGPRARCASRRGVGENYNQTTAGLHAPRASQSCARPRRPGSATSRSTPRSPTPTSPTLMVQAYGAAGLNEPDKAVAGAGDRDRRPRGAADDLYPSSRSSPTAPSRTARATSAERKALALAPKAQRKHAEAHAQDDRPQKQSSASTSSRLGPAASAPERLPRTLDALMALATRPCSSTGRAADS